MAAFINLVISLKSIQPQVIFTTPNYRGREVGFPCQLSTQEAMDRIQREVIPRLKAGTASEEINVVHMVGCEWSDLLGVAG